MIRNIPNKYTQQRLLDALDNEGGQRDRYDFLYLPMDQKNNCNVGYAFINFVSPLFIVDFYQRFNGQKWNQYNSNKICKLCYARIQGRKQLEKNFSTMQQSIPGDNGLTCTGKVRPFIEDRPMPSADELTSLRVDLLGRLFEDQELAAAEADEDACYKDDLNDSTRGNYQQEKIISVPKRKKAANIPIRLHNKLGPQCH